MNKILTLILSFLLSFQGISQTLMTDSFNRANGALGTNWTTWLNPTTINNNALAPSAVGIDCGAIFSAVVFNPNQYSSATVQNLIPNFNYALVGVRMSGSTGYVLATDGSGGVGHCDLNRVDNGNFTLLQALPTTFATGDTIKLEIVGSLLKCYKNGIQIGTNFTDATYTTGRPGVDVYCQNTPVATIDNWFGGDYTVTAMSPVCVTPPALTGTMKIGNTLTTSTGAWLNSPTAFSIKWQRCDATGNGCVDINGPINTTYTLVGADTGKTVRSVVSAANATGITVAASFASPVIAGNAAPVKSKLKYAFYYPTWNQDPLGTNASSTPPENLDYTNVDYVIHFGNGNIGTISPYLTLITNEVSPSFGGNASGLPGDSVEWRFSLQHNPGNGTPSRWYQDSLITVAHRNGTKVLLCLQAVDPKQLNAIIVDSTKIDLFCNATTKYLARRGYDGVDVNIEGWVTPWPSNADLSRFIRRLYYYMGTNMSPRGVITFSAGIDNAGNFDVANDQYIDMFWLESYGYYNNSYTAFSNGRAAGNMVWHVTPLDSRMPPFASVSQVRGIRGSSWTSWVNGGHAKNKIAIGMYAGGIVQRGTDTIFSTQQTTGEVSYSSAWSMLTKGGTLKQDTQAKVPYIAGTATSAQSWPMNLTSGQKFLIAIEDSASIKAKISYADSVGIGGVWLYEIGLDFDRTQPKSSNRRNVVHQAIYNALGTSIIPPPPPPPPPPPVVAQYDTLILNIQTQALVRKGSADTTVTLPINITLRKQPVTPVTTSDSVQVSFQNFYLKVLRGDSVATFPYNLQVRIKK